MADKSFKLDGHVPLTRSSLKIRVDQFPASLLDELREFSDQVPKNAISESNPPAGLFPLPAEKDEVVPQGYDRILHAAVYWNPQLPGLFPNDGVPVKADDLGVLHAASGLATIAKPNFWKRLWDRFKQFFEALWNTIVDMIGSVLSFASIESAKLKVGGGYKPRSVWSDHEDGLSAMYYLPNGSSQLYRVSIPDGLGQQVNRPFIGNQTSEGGVGITFPERGRLYFFFGDKKQKYDDNDGYTWARITILRPRG